MSAYTDKLEDALILAHNSGDMEGAKVLANELKVWSPNSLTFAEKNIAPVFENLYAATGLGSKPVQDLASGAANSYRTIGNLVKTGMGDQAFPNTGSGSGWQTVGDLLDPITMAAGEGAFKLGAKAIPYVKDGASWLMKSAMKPIKKDIVNGAAYKTIQTLFDEGLNSTRGGVDKIKDSIGGINDQIAQKIANSSAVINKNSIFNPLDELTNQTAKQFDALPDLAAIDKVKQSFLNNPLLGKGVNPNDIPIQLAQEMKQGTYAQIAKKYGQLGTAETEAQKAGARGLKEEIVKAEPDLIPLNARDSKLYDALGVMERSRIPLQSNNNLLGLATLTHQPNAFIATMLDKSALAKSLTARFINKTAPLAPYATGLLGYGIGQASNNNRN